MRNIQLLQDRLVLVTEPGNISEKLSDHDHGRIVSTSCNNESAEIFILTENGSLWCYSLLEASSVGYVSFWLLQFPEEEERAEPDEEEDETRDDVPESSRSIDEILSSVDLDKKWFYISYNAGVCAVVAVSRSGSIATIEQDPSTGKYDLAPDQIGEIDGGIAAAKWSPDQTCLLIITDKNNSMIMMSSTWEVLTEIPLSRSQASRVLGSPCAISWCGDGESFALASVDRQQDAHDTPNSGNSSMESGVDGTPKPGSDAARQQHPQAAKVRVYSRDLSLLAVGRNVTEGAGSALRSLGEVAAFATNGSYVAVSQRKTKSSLQVAFLERNGLRHGDFDLKIPPIYEQSGEAPVFAAERWRVDALQWDVSSSLLAVGLTVIPQAEIPNALVGAEELRMEQNNKRGAVQLYYRSNFQWYLKQQWVSGRDGDGAELSLMGFDAEQAGRLYIAAKYPHLGSTDSKSEGGSTSRAQICLRVVDFTWDLFSSSNTSDCTVAVVDGALVKLSPLGRNLVPPPMSHSSVSLASFRDTFTTTTNNNNNNYSNNNSNNKSSRNNNGALSVLDSPVGSSSVLATKAYAESQRAQDVVVVLRCPMQNRIGAPVARSSGTSSSVGNKGALLRSANSVRHASFWRIEKQNWNPSGFGPSESPIWGLSVLTDDDMGGIIALLLGDCTGSIVFESGTINVKSLILQGIKQNNNRYGDGFGDNVHAKVETVLNKTVFRSVLVSMLSPEETDSGIHAMRLRVTLLGTLAQVVCPAASSGIPGGAVSGNSMDESGASIVTGDVLLIVDMQLFQPDLSAEAPPLSSSISDRKNNNNNHEDDNHRSTAAAEVAAANDAEEGNQGQEARIEITGCRVLHGIPGAVLRMVPFPNNPSAMVLGVANESTAGFEIVKVDISLPASSSSAKSFAQMVDFPSRLLEEMVTLPEICTHIAVLSNKDVLQTDAEAAHRKDTRLDGDVYSDAPRRNPISTTTTTTTTATHAAAVTVEEVVVIALSTRNRLYCGDRLLEREHGVSSFAYNESFGVLLYTTLGTRPHMHMCAFSGLFALMDPLHMLSAAGEEGGYVVPQKRMYVEGNRDGDGDGERKAEGGLERAAWEDRGTRADGDAIGTDDAHEMLEAAAALREIECDEPRPLERGARLVAVVSGGDSVVSARVIVQMPRGNLEAFEPRALVLLRAQRMLLLQARQNESFESLNMLSIQKKGVASSLVASGRILSAAEESTFARRKPEVSLSTDYHVVLKNLAEKLANNCFGRMFIAEKNVLEQGNQALSLSAGSTRNYFRECVSLLRKQRVDLNFLVDFSPQLFLTHIDAFVMSVLCELTLSQCAKKEDEEKQATKVDHGKRQELATKSIKLRLNADLLCQFISTLDGNDVALTKYWNNLSATQRLQRERRLLRSGPENQFLRVTQFGNIVNYNDGTAHVTAEGQESDHPTAGRHPCHQEEEDVSNVSMHSSAAPTTTTSTPTTTTEVSLVTLAFPLFASLQRQSLSTGAGAGAFAKKPSLGTSIGIDTGSSDIGIETAGEPVSAASTPMLVVPFAGDHKVNIVCRRIRQSLLPLLLEACLGSAPSVLAEETKDVPTNIVGLHAIATEKSLFALRSVLCAPSAHGKVDSATISSIVNPILCTFARQRPPLVVEALQTIRCVTALTDYKRSVGVHYSTLDQHQRQIIDGIVEVLRRTTLDFDFGSQNAAADALPTSTTQSVLNDIVLNTGSPILQSALKYLAFLADGSTLFNAALGECDFEMARAVASRQQSQLDPRQYMPLIQKFESLGIKRPAFARTLLSPPQQQQQHHHQQEQSSVLSVPVFFKSSENVLGDLDAVVLSAPRHAIMHLQVNVHLKRALKSLVWGLRSLDALCQKYRKLEEYSAYISSQTSSKSVEEFDIIIASNGASAEDVEHAKTVGSEIIRILSIKPTNAEITASAAAAADSASAVGASAAKSDKSAHMYDIVLPFLTKLEKQYDKELLQAADFTFDSLPRTVSSNGHNSFSHKLYFSVLESMNSIRSLFAQKCLAQQKYPLAISAYLSIRPADAANAIQAAVTAGYWCYALTLAGVYAPEPRYQQQQQQQSMSGLFGAEEEEEEDIQQGLIGQDCKKDEPNAIEKLRKAVENSTISPRRIAQSIVSEFRENLEQGFSSSSSAGLKGSSGFGSGTGSGTSPLFGDDEATGAGSAVVGVGGRGDEAYNGMVGGGGALSASIGSYGTVTGTDTGGFGIGIGDESLGIGKGVGRDQDKVMEAARMSVEYCEDAEGAVAILLAGRRWLAALQTALRFSRLDLRDEIVSIVTSAAQEMIQSFPLRIQRIRYICDELRQIWCDPTPEIRLAKVASTEDLYNRTLLQQTTENGTIGGQFDDNASDFSAASSAQQSLLSISSRSTRSSRSSRNSSRTGAGAGSLLSRGGGLGLGFLSGGSGGPQGAGSLSAASIISALSQRSSNGGGGGAAARYTDMGEEISTSSFRIEGLDHALLSRGSVSDAAYGSVTVLGGGGAGSSAVASNVGGRKPASKGSGNKEQRNRGGAEEREGERGGEREGEEIVQDVPGGRKYKKGEGLREGVGGGGPRTANTARRQKRRERSRTKGHGKDIWGLRKEAALCEELVVYANLGNVVDSVVGLVEVLLMLEPSSFSSHPRVAGEREGMSINGGGRPKGVAGKFLAMALQEGMQQYNDALLATHVPLAPSYPAPWLLSRAMNSVAHFQVLSVDSASAVAGGGGGGGGVNAFPSTHSALGAIAHHPHQPHRPYQHDQQQGQRLEQEQQQQRAAAATWWGRVQIGTLKWKRAKLHILEQHR